LGLTYTCFPSVWLCLLSRGVSVSLFLSLLFSAYWDSVCLLVAGLRLFLAICFFAFFIILLRFASECFSCFCWGIFSVFFFFSSAYLSLIGCFTVSFPRFSLSVCLVAGSVLTGVLAGFVGFSPGFLGLLMLRVCAAFFGCSYVDASVPAPGCCVWLLRLRLSLRVV